MYREIAAQVIVTTRLRVVCYYCRCLGPAGHSDEGARLQALDNRWTSCEHAGGFLRWECPSCRVELAACTTPITQGD